MANLRELRGRIASIKSTHKITSAMKMVAAARLRQAQEAVTESGYYSASLGRIMIRLAKTVAYRRAQDKAKGIESQYELSRLITGGGKDQRHLVIVFASSRGLCGGFNINIAKQAAAFIRHLQSENRIVRLICVGSKGTELLKEEFGKLIVATFNSRQSPLDQRADAENMMAHLINMYEKGTIDACSVIYNHFHSAISQEVHIRPIVPLQAARILQPFTGENPWKSLVDGSEGTFELKRPIPRKAGTLNKTQKSFSSGVGMSAKMKSPQYRTSQVRQVLGTSETEEFPLLENPTEYDFEPSNPQDVLNALLPEILTTLIYHSSLESSASENGARMTAMDNATNNAADIIDDLTLIYNRTRQALITSELTEIIAGADAL